MPVPGQYVLLVRYGGDDRHQELIDAIRAALPNLAWSGSWQLHGGKVDSIDVLEFQAGEDPAEVERAVTALGVASFELVEATPDTRLLPPGPGLVD
jgi:hypothetical protein